MIDWGRLAGLAGCLFEWRPAEFWAATPAELATLVSALSPRSEAPVDLDELKRRFPDG